ncbi:unnamed protein product, partial [Staurois parvus]
ITRRCPVFAEDPQRGGGGGGRELLVNKTVLLPVSLGTLHSTAMQSSVLTMKHTHRTQYTVNPLLTPDVNPFLPSAISTVSVLFISTDHCIGVTGDISDTKSVPPSVRMPSAVPL